MTKLENILRARGHYTGIPTQTKGGLAALAREVGVSRSAISRHIHRDSRLTDDNLKKIAFYLDLPVADLIDKEKEA